jgi:hypothetical protein
MLTAALHQPVSTPPLTIVADTRKRISAFIFSISFNYLHKIADIKVLKMVYPDKDVIYKIVLNSSFNQPVRDCWLQHQPQGWVILLGHQLDQHLVNAITTAISSGNFQ